MPLVTFQTGELFGFGVLAGDDFGLPTADFDGVGVLAGDFNRVGVLVADFDGVGVLAGDDLGSAVAFTFWNVDFSEVRCGDSCPPVVGNGITVGSSTAVGCLAGVGVVVAVTVAVGVEASSGSNSRPRRCETVGAADAPETIGKVTIGAGVCARDIATRLLISTDNAKHFRMPSRPCVVYGEGDGVGVGFADGMPPGVNTTVSIAGRRHF